MTSLRRTHPRLVLASWLLAVAGARPLAALQDPPAGYDYAREAARAAAMNLDDMDPMELRAIFAARRERALSAIPEGAMLVFSVEQAQTRRLEFQVPHSENHDLTYLTGLDGVASLDSALLLVPGGESYSVVLYTSADPSQLKAATGIEEVRPYAALEEDLSVAFTDYRDWRITQRRRRPLPGALARAWGSKDKVLYLNYPRFLRLGMAEPSRFELFDKLKRFSPELVQRDSADVLDRLRMFHDAYSLASLRRAVAITGEGLAEGMAAIRPGMTEAQVMEIIDFVYRYRGAYLGFPTAVRKHPMGGRGQLPPLTEAHQPAPRSGRLRLEEGDMVHFDTGASFNHHSADIQRSMPVSGRFSAEQRRLYEIALNVQKTVIARIKPGVTWGELHDLAVRMLRDAGGYDRHYTYGIGHFIGMEVHDEGNYDEPLQAGMALAIEQGVAPPDGPRVAFEDNVIVTPTGHEWISRHIPIEITEIESLLRQESSLSRLVTKRPFSLPSTRATTQDKR